MKKRREKRKNVSRKQKGRKTENARENVRYK